MNNSTEFYNLYMESSVIVRLKGQLQNLAYGIDTVYINLWHDISRELVAAMGQY